VILPLSEHGAQQPQYSSQPQQGQPSQPVYNQLLPSGPDRPTPIGLGLAGAGLLLLAIGSLIPQISFSGDDEDLEYFSGAAIETAGVGLPGLAPALILVVLVGWAAAGIKPGLQWAAKIGGIGLAAITAAAALHPVIEVNGIMDGEIWEDLDVEAKAGGGIWLYILAAVLLAVSIFLMRWAPAKQPAAPQYAQQPQPPYQQPQQPPVQPTVQQPTQPPGSGWPGHNPQQ